MEPITAVTTGLKVFNFVRTHWMWFLVAGVAAWGGWQYLGREEAEKALADQKVHILEDANKAWAERDQKRQEFEKEVREGLAKLTATQTAARTQNDNFKRSVNSNANSSTLLSPADLGDFQLLESGGGKAGGNPLRPAGQPANVR